MNLGDVLLGRSVLVVSGSGGVGKTTLSAALALAAAHLGRRALVITIDPARRLANALGLEALGNRPERLPDSESLPGEMWAMTLNTQRTWDELIHRYAPSDSARDNILNNRIYQALSDELSGSQEYMALEKLHELHFQNRFDLIVLDTPPSRNALEFLRAPGRMSRFIRNHKFFQVFLGIGRRSGAWSMRMVSLGSTSLLHILERVIGSGLLHDFAEFFRLFEGMITGFGDRSEEIDRLLHGEKTLFLLVTTPEPPAIREARFFQQKLEEEELHFGGLLLNRVRPNLLPEVGTGQEPWRSLLHGVLPRSVSDRDCRQRTLETAVRRFARFQRRVWEEQARIAGLRSMLKKEEVYAQVPLLSGEVGRQEELAEIAAILLDA